MSTKPQINDEVLKLLETHEQAKARISRWK